MTFDQLWPLLLVTALGAGLLFAAVSLYRRSAWLFALQVAVAGLLLLWSGTAAITDLAGKP